MKDRYVIMTEREYYGVCNCSCFETDEIIGFFDSEEEAEKFAKKNLRPRWVRIRKISDKKFYLKSPK